MGEGAFVAGGLCPEGLRLFMWLLWPHRPVPAEQEQPTWKRAALQSQGPVGLEVGLGCVQVWDWHLLVGWRG